MDHAPLQTIFPIAEIFTSVQGEGFHTGVPATFIRLAGCTVGVPLKGQEPYELCTLWNSRTFLCDTNYGLSAKYRIADILNQLPQTKQPIAVCITGGEPVAHPKLPDLMEILYDRGHQVWLETSGTLPLDKIPKHVWVTVSPKKDVRRSAIARANEIKFLVDQETTPDGIAVFLAGFDLEFPPFVYLQPVNHVHSIDKDNLTRCLAILQEHPEWRLSTQAHKFWDVR